MPANLTPSRARTDTHQSAQALTPNFRTDAVNQYHDTIHLDGFAKILRSERNDLDLPDIMQAATFAATAHRGILQRRKYTHDPYIVHPIEVAVILSRLGVNGTMLKAALNHDVVEDTAETLESVRAALGDDVATLVDELTDKSQPQDGNRAVRKAIDRDRLAVASDCAQTIKLADLISNGRSIVEHDRKFAVVFMSEMVALLDVMSRGDVQLMQEARSLMRAFHEPHRRTGVGL